MTRPTLVLSVLALATLGLAGCSSMHDSMHGGGSTDKTGYATSAPAAPSTKQVYTATLTAAEEVPPAANSKGTGTAEVTIDTKTNELTWKVSYSGLTGPATAGHIHGPAGKGASAGVIVPFAGVQGQTSASGKGKIDQTQYGDLAAGLYYVNIHTAQYPNGEIRGQLARKQ